MAVAVSATGTKLVGGSAVTTINYTGITTISGDTALIATLVTGASGVTSAWTATWDNGGTNQTMTLIKSQTSGNAALVIFGLRNPTAGNKTLALSWSDGGTHQFPVVCAQSYTGSDTTSDVAAFLNATGGTTGTLAVTSATNNRAIGAIAATGALTSLNQTSIYLDTTSSGCDSASSQAAGAATVTFTATGASGSIAMAGFDLAASTAATTVGWGFDPGLPTILKRPPHRNVAPWNSISRVEEETPPPRWQNVGWEVQSFQPANPATTNLSRSNRLAASSFARGDDGTEFPQVQWFNAGGEVQPFQPPNPATTNISRNNRRWAALVDGDDVSGDESSTTNWRNFGFEIQSVQPPNPITTNISLNNRRAATLAQGDGGVVQPTTTQAQVINWGFDPQPIQPPRFRLQRWASIVNGDDASGDETATVNWINSGWETQSVQPPKLRLQRWAAFVDGDDASGEDSTLVNWFNIGWEVQSPQPPHPRREKSGAVAPLSNVESVFVPPVVTTPSLFESALPTLKIRWSNRGSAAGGDSQFASFDMTPWTEPQSVQPPHRRPERAGAIMRGPDGIEKVVSQIFVTSGWGFDQQPIQPPKLRLQRWAAFVNGDDATSEENALVNWPNAGWEIQSVQPPAYPKTRQRYAATKGKSQFPIWTNFYPWGFEVQPPQPPHPRPERSGALAKGDEGIENTYTFVGATIVRWGFDGVYPQPPHPRPERSGAIQRGDDGTENTYTFVPPPVFTWAFDAQAVQPPQLKPSRRGGGLKHRSQFAIPAQWLNSGWENQPPQPPHPRSERSGSLMRGDDGTENPMPVILPPQVVNWGYDGVWPQPPRAPKVRQRGTAIKGRSSFAIFSTFVTWGGEVQSVQPPHPRPEKSGAIARGDDGIENRFIFVPIQVINWGFDGVWPQPPHPRPERAGSIQKGDEGIEFTYIFVPPTIVRWGYDGVWPQPPHPRREKAGSIMRGDDGVESTYVFVPPTIVNWGYDGIVPQPPHPRHERAEGICGTSEFLSSDSFPWLTLFQEPPLRHLRWEKAGGIMPIEPGIEATYIFVQRAGVFYAKSTITAATGQTVISRAKTQTIVKGEPA